MVYDRGRMKLAHTSGSHHYVAMVNKPPKPPCWRDFVTQSKSRAPAVKAAATFSDITPPNTSRPVTCSDQQQQQLQQQQLIGGNEPTHAQCLAQTAHARSSSQSSKVPRRHRKRLHRTRSEMSIEHGEIPDMNCTVTLAETKPREFGLRKTQFDAHVYIEENTRRCERWLEQVRASRPLEDVHFAQGSGIELDIPDEESTVCRNNDDVDDDVNDVDSASADGAPLTSRKSSLSHGATVQNRAGDGLMSAGGATIAGGQRDHLAGVIIVTTDDVSDVDRHAEERTGCSGSVTSCHVRHDPATPGEREYAAEGFSR